ncbi:MAG: hypothetical protein JXA03_07175 [Bacteroidales bacterium]|nr:hypothetical protein [Bacteroidales bacterium]
MRQRKKLGASLRLATLLGLMILMLLTLACEKEQAKLTTCPAAWHNSYTRTYHGTGMGTESPAYDPFNISIYE